jgi:hypothetical protein
MKTGSRPAHVDRAGDVSPRLLILDTSSPSTCHGRPRLATSARNGSIELLHVEHAALPLSHHHDRAGHRGDACGTIARALFVRLA